MRCVKFLHRFEKLEELLFIWIGFAAAVVYFGVSGLLMFFTSLMLLMIVTLIEWRLFEKIIY